jgi:hypothetical protein
MPTCAILPLASIFFNEVWKMYNLIVLGLVPGTNFQITFTLLLKVVLVVSTIIFLVTLRRSHLIRNWLITRSVARTIRHRQLA